MFVISNHAGIVPWTHVHCIQRSHLNNLGQRFEVIQVSTPRGREKPPPEAGGYRAKTRAVLSLGPK